MADIHILALDATRQGGAGVYTARFAKELASRGHNVTLICHEANIELKTLITVHELPRIVSSRPFGLWQFSSFLQLRNYRNILSKLSLSPPTVVFGSAQPMTWPYHQLYPDRPLIYLPHSLVAPIELATYQYANCIQRRFTIATYHFLEKKCLQHAAYTIRFTETACKAFRKQYGDSACSNLTVVQMPIEIPLLTERKKPSSTFKLLSVGRLIRSKNLLFLLKALSQMLELKWHLDLVGTGGEQKSLETWARQNGLESRVTFHGHSEEVDQFYRQADLFVFPSALENLPLVLLEAMSHSLPTLSFRPDGINFVTATDEVISHEQNGLLANNFAMFEKLLREAIERKMDIGPLGSAAARTVNDNHRWDVHMKQMELIIRKAKNKNVYDIS